MGRVSRRRAALWCAALFLGALLSTGCDNGSDTKDDTTQTSGDGTDSSSDLAQDQAGPADGQDSRPLLDSQEALAGASVIRGGRLYDEWYVILNVDGPVTNHPLYPAAGTQSGAESWRCVNCHGWDYKGVDGAFASGPMYTGVGGILDTSLSPEEVYALLRSTDTAAGGHSYTQLSETDLWDIVRFVREGMLDTDTYIDPLTKDSRGDWFEGWKIFSSPIGCTNCHGADGMAINYLRDLPYQFEFLPNASRDNPWKAFHKVRYSQPGSNPEMPNATSAGWSLEDVMNVLAYGQSLHIPEFDTADMVRGGLLYDTWWPQGSAPTTVNRLYPATSLAWPRDTWRCNECHGWDYRGVNGDYATGSHYTGIKGLLGTKMTAHDIATMLRSTTDLNGHGFNVSKLSDKDMWDLILFIKAGIINTDLYIDRQTKTFFGDASLGASKYNSAAGETAGCILCHDTDGLFVNMAADYEFKYVGMGSMVTNNPWRSFHKIRYGGLKSIPRMPTAMQYGMSYKDMMDTLAYAQSLFDADVDKASLSKGGALYDRWWATNFTYSEPVSSHPLYPGGVAAGAESWRCVTCHGWDYRGDGGATGFVGITDSTRKPRELKAILENSAGHAYSSLTPEDLWSLTFFVKFGNHVVDAYVDGSGNFLGDATAGQQVFERTDSCHSCHGMTGIELDLDPGAGIIHVGGRARATPQRTLHKLRYGQPGAIMPNSEMLRRTSGDNANVGSYAQTLPQ